MPAKKTSTKKKSSKNSKLSFKSPKTWKSRKGLLFIAAFALIGGFLLFRVFAQPVTEKWSGTIGGTNAAYLDHKITMQNGNWLINVQADKDNAILQMINSKGTIIAQDTTADYARYQLKHYKYVLAYYGIPPDTYTIRVTTKNSTIVTKFDVSAGYQAPDAPPPVDGTKPTDATVGPTVALTSAPGGNIANGTYNAKHFTSGLTINGPVTIKDCIVDGGIEAHDGPVVLENCIINGWFGVTTDNKDPSKAIMTMRHSKVIGPVDNDTMRIGSQSVFGDNSVYVNTVISDSIIYSPYSATSGGHHFDLIQTGGGHNVTFNNVVFSYKNNPFGSVDGATSYINNGVQNPNFTVNNGWFEGGGVSYTLYGPMVINKCVINRSTAGYGMIYPTPPKPTLYNCVDDTGAVVQ